MVPNFRGAQFLRLKTHLQTPRKFGAIQYVLERGLPTMCFQSFNVTYVSSACVLCACVCVVAVGKSKCPGYVGITGIVVQETQNTFKLICKDNRVRSEHAYITT